MNILEYLDNLNSNFKSGLSNEQTCQGNLQSLLKSYDKKLKVINDSVFVAVGAPDYYITKNNIPVGFINPEDIGIDLKSNFLKDKFDRYTKSLNNILITNYLEFQFYNKGEFKKSVQIAEIHNFRINPLPEYFTVFIDLIKDFCSNSGQIFNSTCELGGIAENWGISFDQNDQIVSDYLWKIANSDEQYHSNYQKLHNLNALKMFINRTTDTKFLCDMIWKLEEGYCAELKIFLGIGIAYGEGAQVTGRQIRQYIENPEALFRRTRDKEGNLILNKTAKGDHPNKELLKSAYENVVKIIASLNNQSYLLADHNRWLNMDMIIGIRISTSGVHETKDICDELAGVYPKTFILLGWHLCCHCHVTPVMGSETNFMAYLRGAEKLDNAQITEMPENFINYVERNRDQIAKMKIQPDWVKYNFKNGDIRNSINILNQPF
jgi:hypothetical protein